MATGRQTEQEGTDDRNLQSPLQDSQTDMIRALRNVPFPSMTELQSCLEPLIRRVVQDVVPSIIHQRQLICQRTRLNQTEKYGARAFQLCFINKLPPAVYTLSKLKANDGAPIQIALCDTTSQCAVVTSAPQSFIKIEICALNGDFSSDDWTANEFNANIVRERENKGPLLQGDKFVVLKNGTGVIPTIKFADNSSWIRSGKFRIGAKVAESAEGINIREARSDPFKVKDSRGEAYEKHDCPSLNDPIWRLKKIAKNGKFCKHLSSHGIYTVKDLLHLHNTDPASFEQIFGNIPRKWRETIIEHAKASRELDPMEGPPVTLERELPSLNDFMAIDEPSQAAGQSRNPYQCLEQFITAQQDRSTSQVGEGVHNEQVGSDQIAEWMMRMIGSPIPMDEGFQSEMYIDGISSQTLFSNYHLPSTGNGDWGEYRNPSSSSPKFSAHASSSGGNRRTLWRKIRNALKWVRLYAATRNKIRLLPIPHN